MANPKKDPEERTADEMPKRDAQTHESAQLQSALIRLSREQIEALKEQAEKHKVAQKQLTEALGVLWNAQFDLALFRGRAPFLERALGARPLALWDDCSCGPCPGPMCW